MFGIGLGEILLIILVLFLISPRSIPEIMRQMGRFLGALQKYSDEFTSIKKDVREILDTDNIVSESEINPFPDNKPVKRPKTGKNTGKLEPKKKDDV